jgi:UDP-N-acetylmuramoyl-L-alanyl-D-glutamate--2,6-diaminopimelate ligase
MRVAMGADRALLESRLLGRFNAANLLAVCGILLALGHSLGEACQLLAEAGPVPGRMEVVGGGNLPVVVVDYAHTPDALEKALTAAREHCSGRLIVVFGCGGDRDRGKRALMGRAAARLADRAIITDDNPRHEDPQRIVDDILQGIAGGDVTVERDRPRAIALALADATVGDIVLVAGKGHEDYQIVGDERRPYSDRQEVANWLARQSARGNASPPAERGHC